MSILHLCADRNFISDSRKVFDHFYPGDNIFIVNSLNEKLNVISDSNGMIIYNLNDVNNYQNVLKICIDNKVNKIVLHGLASYTYVLIAYLKKEISLKVYWLFWGYELYQTLGYEKGYKMIDKSFNPFDKVTYYMPNYISKIMRKLLNRYNPSKYVKAFQYIDYFCFWNKEDYNLLQKYYKTKIQYRYFAYGANFNGQTQHNLWELSDNISHKIMVNHQASLFGNHDTILKKINNLGIDEKYKIIVPLSYGSNAIRTHVMRQGKYYFHDNFYPILNLLPKDTYFELLKDVDVAIFGQRRQEASGNIIQLLRNGVKVFLRNDNNLLDYYRNKGYYVYSFEDDLKDLDDLKPLSIEQKIHNRTCYLNNMIYYEDFMPKLFD